MDKELVIDIIKMLEEIRDCHSDSIIKETWQKLYDTMKLELAKYDNPNVMKIDVNETIQYSEHY